MNDFKFKIDTDGRYVCPHNPECRCAYLNCEACGWNPEVGQARIKAIMSKLAEQQAGEAK